MMSKSVPATTATAITTRNPCRKPSGSDAPTTANGLTFSIEFPPPAVEFTWVSGRPMQNVAMRPYSVSIQPGVGNLHGAVIGMSYSAADIRHPGVEHENRSRAGTFLERLSPHALLRMGRCGESARRRLRARPHA